MDADYNRAVDAQKGKLKRLYFHAGWKCYNAGMTAGIPSPWAENLIAEGRAVPVYKNDAGAWVPKPSPPPPSPTQTPKAKPKPKPAPRKVVDEKPEEQPKPEKSSRRRRSKKQR
jgi:hypothetical protein